MAADRRRLLRLGIRQQTTLVAVVVVGIVLVAGAAALVILTQRRLESSLTTAVAVRADSVVGLVQANALDDPLPGRDPEVMAQVIDEAGRVIAADPSVAGLPPLTAIEIPPGARTTIRLDELDVESGDIGEDGPYVVAAEGVELAGGPATVLVTASLEDAREAAGAFGPLLAVGLPLLLAIVGLVTWRMTGRSLRPVDQMRREADRITADVLSRRLPVPATDDEIHRLALTLNDMLERLDAAAAQRRRFVADASHELRSPLANLRTMVDVAARDPRGHAVEALTGDLGPEIERLERLVADLLSLARYDDTQGGAVRQDVDLGAIVEDVASTAIPSSEIDATGVEHVIVNGDPAGIERVVRNLVDNALRHASRSVSVHTHLENGFGVVEVTDDGPGIAEEDRSRIFDRFVRLDDSRARDTGGAGLGLAVARAIARGHGGDVELVGGAAGACTFAARFPADTAHASAGDS